MLRKFGFKILTPRSRHGRVHCANSGGERTRENEINGLAMMVFGGFFLMWGVEFVYFAKFNLAMIKTSGLSSS